MSDRQARGQRLAKVSGAIQHSPRGVGWFRVRSSSWTRWYNVNILEQTCSCPDYPAKCKHIYAAEIFAAKVPRPDGLGDRPVTFADIEQEVNELLDTAQAMILNRHNYYDEDFDVDLKAFRHEWRALRWRMSQFGKT
jgi:hypothetical protein